MKRPIFKGLCTALVTPFRDGKVNFELLKALIEIQVGAGADAIVLAGTTGESPTLTREEKLSLFRTSVETARGRCKIIAGTGSNCTASAVELSCAARDCGVDGVLVVTPYYNKCTQTGLVKHYQMICQAARIPVIAYNVPSRTGVDIAVDTCRELAQMEHIAGIKEASGSISKVGHILTACGEELPLYSGNDDQTLPVMALGGMGVISVASNVAPGETKALVSACRAGDYAAAGKHQKRLLPLMDVLFCQVNPIPVKAAMEMLGIPVGECRMPLDGLAEPNREKLRACLDELGVCAYNKETFQ